MFIALLCIAAFSIAGSAAYFSVYGLANTFHGVFWSAIISFGSLEAGKLVATSYLYRYWSRTHFLLKSYLILGVIALMIITSMGIFGYLSTGYQTDSLPLKQLEQQTKLLDEEKTRLIARKQQIDNQIANLPSDYSKSRVKVMKEFKDEQVTVTTRISVLDTQILELKTKQIQQEAHTGPIVYMARAVGMETDDATKWLIYLIMFVFDPMAVALTLAVNTAVKSNHEEVNVAEIDDGLSDLWVEPEVEPEVVVVEVPTIPKSDYATYNGEDITYPVEISDGPDWSIPVQKQEHVEPEEEVIPEVIEPIVELSQPVVEQPLQFSSGRYLGVNSNTSLNDLIGQHQYYQARIDNGTPLTPNEQWAHQAIKEALHKHGFNIYI